METVHKDIHFILYNFICINFQIFHLYYCSDFLNLKVPVDAYLPKFKNLIKGFVYLN